MDKAKCGIRLLRVSEESPPLQREAELIDLCNKLVHGQIREAFPGAQPTSLTRQKVFDELLTRPYLVCEKTDGERYILLAHEGRVYLIDRRVRFWLCPIQLPLPSSDPRAPGWHHNTLLDGELVVDTVETPPGEGAGGAARTPRMRYLIYDAMRIGGEDLTHRTLLYRLRRALTDVVLPKEMLLAPPGVAAEPVQLYVKDFFELWQLRTVMDIAERLPHRTDGLVFTPVTVPYAPGTCPALLKWKPNAMNTVDFKLQVLQGPGPRKLHVKLLVGLKRPDAWLVKFCGHWLAKTGDAYRQLIKDPSEWNEKIAECKWQPSAVTFFPNDALRFTTEGHYEDGGWVLQRLRSDKQQPNDLRTAKRIVESIEDDLKIEDIEKLVLEAREKGTLTVAAESGEGHLQRAPPPLESGAKDWRAPHDGSDRPKPACSFFLQGRCKRGADCKFLHMEPKTGLPAKEDDDDDAPLVDPKAAGKASGFGRPACVFFLSGHCRFGSKCKDPHPGNPAGKQAAAPAEGEAPRGRARGRGRGDDQGRCGRGRGRGEDRAEARPGRGRGAAKPPAEADGRGKRGRGRGRPSQEAGLLSFAKEVEAAGEAPPGDEAAAEEPPSSPEAAAAAMHESSDEDGDPALEEAPDEATAAPPSGKRRLEELAAQAEGATPAEAPSEDAEPPASSAPPSKRRAAPAAQRDEAAAPGKRRRAAHEATAAEAAADAWRQRWGTASEARPRREAKERPPPAASPVPRSLSMVANELRAADLRARRVLAAVGTPSPGLGTPSTRPLSPEEGEFFAPPPPSPAPVASVVRAAAAAGRWQAMSTPAAARGAVRPRAEAPISSAAAALAPPGAASAAARTPGGVAARVPHDGAARAAAPARPVRRIAFATRPAAPAATPAVARPVAEKAFPASAPAVATPAAATPSGTTPAAAVRAASTPAATVRAATIPAVGAPAQAAQAAQPAVAASSGGAWADSPDDMADASGSECGEEGSFFGGL